MDILFWKEKFPNANFNITPKYGKIFFTYETMR